MSSETTPPFQLSDEQLRILHGSGNQVVVAGAGTGKTETLTQRVLHLLMREGDDSSQLHELIALTFTDKAAGEMRQRIYQSILKRLVVESDDLQRNRLNALRTGFAEHNRIGTFDSFIHRLLSLYPEQNLVPPGFTPMSSYDERDLFTQLARAFWHYAEGLEGVERTELFDLLELFERRQTLMLVAELAREETHRLEELAENIDEAQYRVELERLCSIAVERVYRREGRRLNDLWARYIAALPLDLPPVLQNALHDPGRLRFRGSDVLTQKHTFAKKFVKPDIQEVCEALEAGALRQLEPWRNLDQHLSDVGEKLKVTDETFAIDLEARQILRRLARLALWWAQQRRALCWRNGWADFTDLQRAALQLLSNSDEVSSKLRANARHILIDEFQDTNIAQWQLIDRFRNQDNVLIVGDGKQAIYQFRGGDITVFEEVQRVLIGEETPDQLTFSRRSAPVIVDFCNLLFEALLPPELNKEVYEAAFQALQSGREGGGESGVYVVRAERQTSGAPQMSLDFETPAPVDLDEQAILAQTVALLLAEIQADADEGTSQRRPEFATISEKIGRNEPGVIGLLFRTHERKAVFESALRDHDVRFVSIKGIGFFQSQQVADVINLARFGLDAEDSPAVAGILRSPLIGLSDRALLELRVHHPEKSLWLAAVDTVRGESEVSLSQADWRALRLGIPRLQRWREQFSVQPFSWVLELVWRESELAFSDALYSDSPQRIENWRKIIEVLRDREERGNGSVREVVEFLTAQASDEESESEAALPGNSGSIQLMTIFAAKGLGFDMTIVAQTDGVPRGDSGALKKGAFPTRDDVHYSIKPPDNGGKKSEPLLWTILREEDRARQEAEFRRLLYVACTRAKDHLLLVLPAAPRTGSWAEMLEPFTANLAVYTHGELRRRATKAAPRATPSVSVLAELRILPPLQGNALSADIGVTTLLERQAPAVARRRTGKDRKERREWGRVVHRVLELERLDDATLKLQIENLAFSHNLPESVVDTLLQQVQSADAWLKDQGYSRAGARREVPFSVPAAALRERFPVLESVEWLNGVIDLMVPDGARWAIVDFKTGSDEQAALYERQLQMYAAAVELSGLEVSACWLLFLNEDGTLSPTRVEEL